MDSTTARSLPPEGNGTHLWIPEPDTSDSTGDPAPSSSRVPQLLRDRLYVGNLSPTVDEYALLQVFTKFGKIAKLDFLFHRSGLNKGKPRGYAFVEFMSEADAAKALQTANGKLLRGRKLVVTYAQQAPNHESRSTLYTGRNKRSDATPTALSLAKSGGIARPEAKTSSKIAMMEAKLRQMANSTSFAERPALPSKPTGPQTGALVGTHSQGGSRRGTRLTPDETGRIRSGGGRVGQGQLATLSPMGHAEPSEALRPAALDKRRSIPGVKIVRGGSSGESRH